MARSLSTGAGDCVNSAARDWLPLTLAGARRDHSTALGVRGDRKLAPVRCSRRAARFLPRAGS